ncbi:MAG: hypothetical protein ACLQT7_00485 [Candidatus Dormibacteria bacterium]
MLLAQLVPDPSWLNSGDNAWQITAATLVGIMSVPGLAILYALSPEFSQLGSGTSCASSMR